MAAFAFIHFSVHTIDDECVCVFVDDIVCCRIYLYLLVCLTYIYMVSLRWLGLHADGMETTQQSGRPSFWHTRRI